MLLLPVEERNRFLYRLIPQMNLTRMWIKRRTVRLIGIAALLVGTPALPSIAAAGWLQIDTEYFTVIFEPADEAVAAELAGFSDDIYGQLSAYLGVDPDRRIPIVIRSRTSSANGYFTQFPTRIVIFAATPSTPILGPQMEWIQLVFTHELTHYLQLTEPVGWNRFARVFGPSAAAVNQALVPGWMAEGPAIHTETRFTTGGRGINPVFEMQYVAALLADQFWSFDQALYGSDFAPRSRIYVGGYVMVDYIVRTYGIDQFMELSNAYMRHPVLGIRRAIREVLKVDADGFYDAMLADLEEQYEERKAFTGGEVVAPDDAGYWFLVRGRTEIYGGSPTSYSTLVTREAWSAGIQSDDRQSAVQLKVDPFSLSMNDDLIIGIRPFVDEFRPDPWVGFTDLVSIDRKSGSVRRLTRGRRLYHSTLHPDGSSVIAVERIGAYSRLVRIQLTADDYTESGSVEVIWNPPRAAIAAPHVSPDGQNVVVVASIDHEQELYVVDLATAVAHRVTSSAGIDEQFPAYVSDSAIWFAANLEGPLALYELNLVHGTVTHLLTDSGGVLYATPVGDGAVYASYSSTGPSVKLVDRMERRAVEWPGGVASNGPSTEAAVDPTSAIAGEAASATALDLLRSRPFLDLPRPELWLPVLLPSRSETGLGAEIGALVIAGSPLENNLGILTAWVNLSSLVPSIAFQLIHYSGPWQASIDIDAAPRYQDATGLRARLESSASLSLGREIARWGVLRRRHSVTATLSGRVISLSTDGVTMPDFFSGSSEENLGAGATLAYASSRETRLADLLGSAGADLSITGIFRTPLGQAEAPLGAQSLGVVGSAGLRVPVAAAMTHMRVSAKSPLLGAEIDTARGTAIARIGDSPPVADPALMVRLGLDSPALMLDLGFRGFNLTRLGISLYLQQVADYVADGIKIRRETLAAIELIANVGYLSAQFSPVVGLVVTVPHGDPARVRFDITYRNATAGTRLLASQIN